MKKLVKRKKPTAKPATKGKLVKEINRTIHSQLQRKGMPTSITTTNAAINWMIKRQVATWEYRALGRVLVRRLVGVLP